VPKSKQVQKTRTVPNMVDVPKMAPFFQWKQWDWKLDRTLEEKGDGFSVKWPADDRIRLNLELKKGEKERERRQPEYVVDLVGSDGSKLTTYPRTLEDYAAWQNATATLRVQRYGGVQLLGAPAHD